MLKDHVRIEPPQAERIPVVYDSPHSGRFYLPEFGHALDMETLRRAEDTHVEALFAHVAEQGAPLVHTILPRTFIDVNRAVEDIDVELIEGDWPLPLAPTRKSQIGHGLLWKQISQRTPIYNRKLTVDEALKRIYYGWKPYHEAVAREIDEAYNRHGTVYLVSCHAMPSRAADRAEYAAQDQAEIVLGDRDGATCDPDFTRLVRDELIVLGYRVEVNYPFKGGEVIRRHSDPAHGRHGLQITVTRRLYMDEETRLRNGYFGKLRRDLRRVTSAIADYARYAARQQKAPAA